jgi:lysophospholipase L1-like esterase
MSDVPERASTWRQNVLLAIASVVFTLLLLGVLEIGLRVAGVGGPDASRTSRLKYQQIYLPVLAPGQRADGSEILRTVDVRLPYQSVLQPKRPGTVRIFTFGGSATAGLGFSPNVTFARALERMLRAGYPDVHFEVVNLGIVALSSKQVRLLVADVCAHDAPDIVIVYSGNNEFLEMHAEKYARAQEGPFARVVDAVRETNSYRLIDRVVSGPPEVPSMADQKFSNDDLRLSEAQLIENIDVSPAEIAGVVDHYAANVDAMAAAAQAAGAHTILMTVASNWRWRGRDDLPADWTAKLLGGTVADGPAAWRRVREATTARLAAAPRKERHEWLYRRAAAEEALGDYPAARADYEAAMNEDPHLRRALDAANDRVRGIAARRGTTLLDAVAILSERAPHGIIGFDEFYDYVHFTPRGAEEIAAALFRTIAQQGWIPGTPRVDPDALAAARVAQIDALHQDAFAIGDFVGFGFDPALIHDRDLWKYERMAKDLDARIARDPNDLPALVYRGNVHAFQVGGTEAAARDYEAALALAPDRPEIRDDLARLRAQAPVEGSR